MRRPLRPSAVWTWQHQAEAIGEQGKNAETGNETAAAGLQEESRQCRGTESGTVHGTRHRATEPHGEVRRRRTWDHRKPAGKNPRRDRGTRPRNHTGRPPSADVGPPDTSREPRGELGIPGTDNGTETRIMAPASRRPMGNAAGGRPETSETPVGKPRGEFGVSGNSVSVSWIRKTPDPANNQFRAEPEVR